MAKVQQVTLTPEVSAKLGEWINLHTQLNSVKVHEFALRQELILQAGFDPSKLEGTQSIDIGNGWRLKAEKKQNYILTNESGQTEKLLASICAEDQLAMPELGISLVKWKPDMSTKAYKELLKVMAEKQDHPAMPKLRENLAAALTVKPGAPSLELIPPETDQESNLGQTKI